MAKTASTMAAVAAIVLGGAAMAAAALGCARANASGTALPARGATLMQGLQGPTCPLAGLYDVDATISQLSSGIAITFVAPPEEREKLRAAVRDMATPQAGAEPVDVFAGCACTSSKPGTGTLPAAPEASRLPPGAEGHARGAPAQARPFVFDTSAREDDTPTGAILLLRVTPSAEATALEPVVREKLAAFREGCAGAR